VSTRLTLAERFWAKVAQAGADECWLWRGSVSSNKYGNLTVEGKTKQAHVVAYELTNGPVPAGKEVCHSCDVNLCCNPAHLWPGTHTQNMRDMMAKKRHKAWIGEQNKATKLNAWAVRFIRYLYRLGYKSEFLGLAFGVSGSTVRRIAAGKIWAHVA
jgi:HNH endonuclease